MNDLDNIFNKPVIGVASKNLDVPMEERKSKRSLSEISSDLKRIRKSKHTNPLSETVNKNTRPYDENFPSLEGLPEPSQGYVPEGTTGDGKGGNIVTKTYSKTSSVLDMSGTLDKAKFNLNKSNREDIEIANKTSPSIVDKLTYKYKNSDFNLDKILNRLSANYGAPGTIAASGALGAALGGLGGLSLGAIKSLGGAESPNYKRNALIGSLIGTLLGSGYGYLRNYDFNQAKKYGSYKKAFALPFQSSMFPNTSFNSFGGINNISSVFNNISNKIMNDYNLDINQKYELVSYIKQQPPDILEALNKLANAAAGAGIGYLIANYLLGMGRRGNIVMAILGGVIGNSLSSNNSLFSKSNNSLTLPSGYTNSYGKLL